MNKEQKNLKLFNDTINDAIEITKADILTFDSNKFPKLNNNNKIKMTRIKLKDFIEEKDPSLYNSKNQKDNK